MFSELIHTGICDFSLPYLQIVNLNAIIIIIFCRQTLRENVIKYLNALLFLPHLSLSLSLKMERNLFRMFLLFYSCDGFLTLSFCCHKKFIIKTPY